MPKYFVWRFSPKQPFRAYGTWKYFEPVSDDLRCIWRGESLEEARKLAKKANRKVGELELK